MARQLSFAEARRRGPRIAVLPDAARVEERLARLARERGFVPGRVAYSLAELGRELIREAQRAGACPEVASPFALQLALRQAARDHSSGPYFAIRNHAGYPRALGDLSAALTEGLLDPVELADLDVPQRPAALARTLLAARAALDLAALVDPHRALRLAFDHLERGGALPAELGRASEIEFEGVLDWTPLRLRLATALAARVRVRIRLPWSTGRPELTESLEPVLRAIEKLPEPAPELALFDPADGSALLPFLRRLFATDGPPAETQVTLLDCASPAAQAREIARRCAALIRRGEAPDGIAIAGRSLGSGIAEEIAAALHRLGIPFRERRGRPAMQASPVRLALSILDLADQDFPRESLIELLSSRLLWLADDGDRLPPQALARVLRQSHVRDDATAGGYAAALAALSARLLRQERDAEPVAETARRVQRIINELRRLPAQASLREHGAALLALLARWGLWRRLRAPEPSDATEALQRAAGVGLWAPVGRGPRRRGAAGAAAAGSAALGRRAARHQSRRPQAGVPDVGRVRGGRSPSAAPGRRATPLPPRALLGAKVRHPALAARGFTGTRPAALAIRRRSDPCHGPEAGGVAPSRHSSAFGVRRRIRAAGACRVGCLRRPRIPDPSSWGRGHGARAGGGRRGFAIRRPLPPHRPRCRGRARARPRVRGRDPAGTLLGSALRRSAGSGARDVRLRRAGSPFRAPARGLRDLRVPDAGQAIAAHRGRRPRRYRAGSPGARHPSPPLPGEILPPHGRRGPAAAARRRGRDGRPARDRRRGDGRVRRGAARRPSGALGIEAHRAARGARRGGGVGARGRARRTGASLRLRRRSILAGAANRRRTRARHRGPDRSARGRNPAGARLQVGATRDARPALEAGGAARAGVPARPLRRDGAAALPLRPRRRGLRLVAGSASHRHAARQRHRSCRPSAGGRAAGAGGRDAIRAFRGAPSQLRLLRAEAGLPAGGAAHRPRGERRRGAPCLSSSRPVAAP